MIVNRHELLKAVTQAKEAVAQKSSFAGSDLINFAEDCIVAFNGRIVCQIPFEHEFQCSVKYGDFVKALQKMPEQEVSIEQLKKVLRIKSSGIQTELFLYQENSLFERARAALPELASGTVYVPETFGEEIRRVLLPDASETTSGVYINSQHMISLDTRTISVVRRTCLRTVGEDTVTCEADSDFEFYTDVKTAKIVSTIADKSSTWTLHNNWLYFYQDDGTIYGFSGLYAKNYPIDKYMPVFKKILSEDTLYLADFPKEMPKVLERLLLFSAAQDRTQFRPITLTLSGSQMTFFSESTSGNLEEIIELENEESHLIKDIKGKIDLYGLQFCLDHTLEFTIVPFQHRCAFVFNAGPWTGTTIINIED